MIDRFEAFIAVKGREPTGPTWYRAGYRCGETGNVICALELPASIVETTILRDARLAVTLAGNGHVRFSVCGTTCEDISEGLPSVTEPIDELVAQMVAVDNLHLEGITSADLNALLQRLRLSIALVQAAIQRLADQQVKTNSR